MKKSLRSILALIIVLALCVTAGLAVIGQAESDTEAFKVQTAADSEQPLSIPEIAKAARSAVVAIETETKVVYNNSYYNSPFDSIFGFGFGSPYGYGYNNPYGNGRDSSYTKKAAGSGVIISEDGYILTNNHVISGADSITVYVQSPDSAEETSYEATLVGASESHDVAVLKIEATGLTPAVFGNSDDLVIGEPAVVIGNPMGTVHGSVTAGIISATEHEMTIDDTTVNAIMTDASINPGNSGGGLFDQYGHLIGVVYAKSVSVQLEGIGYAIPSNDIVELVENIINHVDSYEDQTNGSKIMLGITITDVTEAISKQYNMPVGVYITDVSSMSAAERAGLQRGDIITGFAGEKVTCADDLNAIKAKQTPGDLVEVVIDRNGKELTLSLVVPQPTEVETAKPDQNQLLR